MKDRKQGAFDELFQTMALFLTFLIKENSDSNTQNNPKTFYHLQLRPIQNLP